MSTHQLRASQVIARPVDEVFAFFSRPDNLGRITPPAMGFEQVSTDLDMRAGVEIEHRIRPFLGIPMGWRSRIEAWDPPFGFTDVQATGPYARWRHRHAFAPTPDGGTRIEDQVVYELPLGPLGELAHAIAVRAQLQAIFRHRARTIGAIFADPAANPDPMTVAVAGGTGFVGGAIAAELFRRGHHVVVLSHRGEAARGPLPDAVELRHVDVTDGTGLPQALHDVDVLAIALAFRNSPIEAGRRGRTFMRVDAGGTQRLAGAARAAGISHNAYISGAGAAPDARPAAIARSSAGNSSRRARSKVSGESATGSNGTEAASGIRRGCVSAYKTGSSMLGTPICASTLPSTNSTKLCTTLCG